MPYCIDFCWLALVRQSFANFTVHAHLSTGTPPVAASVDTSKEFLRFNEVSLLMYVCAALMLKHKISQWFSAAQHHFYICCFHRQKFPLLFGVKLSRAACWSLGSYVLVCLWRGGDLNVMALMFWERVFSTKFVNILCFSIFS